MYTSGNDLIAALSAASYCGLRGGGGGGRGCWWQPTNKRSLFL